MPNDDLIKKWVQTWQRAGVALDEVKKQELRDPEYYEKNRELLNSMLQYACDHSTVRLDSGLVEMQKIFMKIHQQKLAGDL